MLFIFLNVKYHSSWLPSHVPFLVVSFVYHETEGLRGSGIVHNSHHRILRQWIVIFGQGKPSYSFQCYSIFETWCIINLDNHIQFRFLVASFISDGPEGFGISCFVHNIHQHVLRQNIVVVDQGKISHLFQCHSILEAWKTNYLTHHLVFDLLKFTTSSCSSFSSGILSVSISIFWRLTYCALLLKISYSSSNSSSSSNRSSQEKVVCIGKLCSQCGKYDYNSNSKDPSKRQESLLSSGIT